MTLINGQSIKQVFNELNDSNLNYILLRNIDDELPSRLIEGKDIDILINKEEEKKMIYFLKSLNFKKMTHPYGEDVYLYGVDKFKKYQNGESSILIDLNFQIAVRSLDQGQWIPLDQELQESAWKNKRFEKLDKNFSYWTLSYNDEFISLVARSIFDKHSFSVEYQKRIIQLLPLINTDFVEEIMNKIFFKYTKDLLHQITNKQFDKIMTNYLQFTDY